MKIGSTIIKDTEIVAYTSRDETLIVCTSGGHTFAVRSKGGQFGERISQEELDTAKAYLAKCIVN